MREAVIVQALRTPVGRRGGAYAGLHAVDLGAEVLRALVREQNDRTLDELGTLYRARTRVRLTRSALWRAVMRLGLERKKSR